MARSLIMLVPLAVCAARLTGFGLSAPRATTQELNRCLTFVRIAATSRRSRAGRGYDMTTNPNAVSRPVSESRPPINSAGA